MLSCVRRVSSGVGTGRIKSKTADDMLQTKPLQDLLSQALSSTIHTAVIATPQGTLIANAINLPANLPSQAESARRKARSLGAIANVVWKNYANIKDVNELWDTSNGESVNERKEGLIWMSIECEVFSLLGCELIVGGAVITVPSPPAIRKGIVTCSSGRQGRTDRHDACKGTVSSRHY